MNDKQKSPVQVGKSDREEVRTKANPIGVDDIGLPSGIKRDEVGRLNDIKPKPGKVDEQS